MTYQTELLRRIEIARDTLAWDLKKPKGFRFKPGQAVDLAIEDPGEVDQAGSIRSLSIASAPEDPELRLAFRLRDTAFKREAARLQPGADNLSLDGPFGSLTLRRQTDRPLVFLAGGIGITPFVSMFRHISRSGSGHRATLLYSFRYRETAAFLEELTGWAEGQAGLELVPVETAGDPARHIGPDLLRRHLNDSARPVFYSAGPPNFVREIADRLEELAVEEDDIRLEEFSGY